MHWLFPAIVATLAGSLVLAGVYYYLYFRQGEKAVRVWAVSWVCYSLRFGAMLMLERGYSPHLWLFVNQTLALVSALLLLWGVFLFFEKKMHPLLIAPFGLNLLWIVWALFQRFSLGLISLPTFFIMGLSYIYTGYCFIRFRKTPGATNWLVGIVFILWGLHKLDYPFLREVQEVAPWGYLFGATLELLAAFGILMIYYETIRERSERASHRASNLLHSVQAGVVIHNPDGTISQVNDEACNILEMGQDQLIGKTSEAPLWQMRDEEGNYVESRNHPAVITLRTGKSLQDQLRFLHFPQERFKWLLINTTAIFKPKSHEIQEVLVTFHDITTLIVTRQNLEVKENLLDQAQRLARMGNFSYNEKTEDLFWSRQLYEIYGRDPQKGAPQAEEHRQYMLPGDWEKIRFLMEDCRKSGAPVQFEYAIRREDGQVRTLLANCQWDKTLHRNHWLFNGAVQDITDRKKAEETLRQSESRLKELVQSIPVLLIAFDQNGHCLYWNDECKRVTGYDARQMLHSPDFWERLYPDPDYRQTVLRNHHGGSRQMETKITTRDGSHRTINWTNISQSIHLPGWHSWIIGVDLTERALYENSLRESENRLRSIMEVTPDIIILLDQDGRILDLNSAYAKRFQQEPEDLLEKRVWDHYPEPLRQKRLYYFQRVIETARPVEGEDERAGIVNHYTLYPVINDKNEVHQVVVFARDITRERQTEENYHMLFDQMINGFALHEVVTNEEGEVVDYRFLAVNPAYEKMVGKRALEIVGHTVREVFPDVEEYWIRTFGQVALEGTPVHFQHYTQMLGAHFEVTAYQPQPGQFACVVQDITERHQLEGQLRQSQKMEALGQLAGGVAHDFNNLLQVISGTVEIARMEEEEGQPEKYYDEILGTVDRGKDLVSRILTFGRRYPGKPQPIQLNERIQDLLKMIGRVLGEHIQYHFEAGENLPTLHADPNQLEQMLMNLCVNARDAMPEGGTLHLRTAWEKMRPEQHSRHPWAAEGSYLHVEVRDTGTGMSPEVQQHIFEPFFTTKDVGKGTGLGLAVVYGIVKQMQGYIHVETEEGKGSCFHLFFPDNAKGPTLSAQDEKREQENTLSAKKGALILLAEDDKGVQQFAMKTLEKKGFQVLVAQNGEEALALFESHQDTLDLALLDVVMPGKSGREVHDIIKTRRPKLPVLLMSGYSYEILETDGLNRDEYEILTKPFSTRHLVQRIQQMLAAATRL